MHELTHASFFSGAGGTDLGLERAGWRTVSFSEVEPYANAVLRHRWPGVPNLGDIRTVDPSAIPRATLWSGGFPCQDLSVAGRRKGLAGERSGLAFAYLSLLERHRPPASLLENVPGLLSSHGGRDMATLVGRLVDLGYGVAWRSLDARFFGVPQRRRRVYVLALRCPGDDPSGRATADAAGEVLAVGAFCDRHPPAGSEEGEDVAGASDGRLGVASTVGADYGEKWGSNQWIEQGHALVYSSTSSYGEWAGGRDAGTLSQRDWKSPKHLVVGRAEVHPNGDGAADGVAGRAHDSPVEEEGLNPRGLDSHRYRLAGNGVVAPVAEWIGLRLRQHLEDA